MSESLPPLRIELRHGSVVLNCITCGREIRVQPARAKKQAMRINCSRACRAEAERRAEVARFWSYVRKTEGGCWIWTRSVNRAHVRGGNHGVFSYGRSKGFAHRYSYVLHRGAIPDGLNVLHTCDEPRCVNPEHLYAGTQKDNIRDAKERGRLVVPKPRRGQNPFCLKGHRRTLRPNGTLACEVCMKVFRARYQQKLLESKYGQPSVSKAS